jgi:hypothetical protein
MQVSLIGLRHLEQARIPISARVNSGSDWIDGMTLPSVGRERAALSVTDKCRRRGGDGTSMELKVPAPLVNIAHTSN